MFFSGGSEEGALDGNGVFFFVFFVFVFLFAFELVSWCFEPSQPQRITSGLFAVEFVFFELPFQVENLCSLPMRRSCDYHFNTFTLSSSKL